jgi:hypothetical protein
VCQRSNGRQHNGRVQRSADNATVRGLRAQSQSRRQKAHRTVNSDCPVHHRTVRWPHLSELQQLNPNGWVTWLAHRTVRCAHRHQPSPTTTLMVGAINTPNHHTSRHPSFSANTFNTRASALNISVGVSRPGVPKPTSDVSPRAPAQMGRREAEREGGK